PAAAGPAALLTPSRDARVSSPRLIPACPRRQRPLQLPEPSTSVRMTRKEGRRRVRSAGEEALADLEAALDRNAVVELLAVRLDDHPVAVDDGLRIHHAALGAAQRAIIPRGGCRLDHLDRRWVGTGPLCGIGED